MEMAKTDWKMLLFMFFENLQYFENVSLFCWELK